VTALATAFLVPQPERMFEPVDFRDVPTITAHWVPPPARLTELLAMPRDLTASEWAELTAFERDAS
jgi:hypothetical protein